VFEGLALGLQAGKGRKQRGMNIQDAPGELLDEIGREQAHESGKTDKVHAGFPQGGDHLAVVGFALESPGRDDARGDIAGGGEIDARGAFAIADDEGDARVGDASGGDAIGQGHEIGAATAEEDADVPGHKISGGGKLAYPL